MYKSKQKRCMAVLLVMFIGACAVVPVVSVEFHAGDYLSPTAIIADSKGDNLYVAEKTAGKVVVVNPNTANVIKTFKLNDYLCALAINSDDSFLYVASDNAKGCVYVIDLKKGKITGRIAAGHSPSAIALSPDDSVLYICNRFDNNVQIYNLKTKKTQARVAVLREPSACVLTNDGRYLFVANSLPTGNNVDNYASSEISVIDTGTAKKVSDILLPNGSISPNGICISPDGRYIYVTHILARYQLPTTQLERGWMNTNALSVINVQKKSLEATVLLDDIDLGAANPWGVSCDKLGNKLYVSHAGTDELSVIDRGALHDKISQVAAGKLVSVSKKISDISNDLAFLVGIRKRISLNGKGPRSLTVVGDKVYVAEYFSDSLSVVDANASPANMVKTIALGPTVKMTKIRRGEMYFHDASLCFQHWQSCSSCHPGDARPDGLSWDLLNDGIGNPKNTKSLLYSHRTPPVMSLGIRDRAETAVRAGIKHIQFAVRPEEDAVAIDQFLKSLKPVPSPYLVNGKLSAAAKRGKKIFEQADCGKCHSGPLYTDLGQYELGTTEGMDKGRTVDTPMLIEIWRTAPYLHDGRAADMKEMLTKYNVNDQHGSTSGLSNSQIDDLAEFVLSQ